MDNGQTVEDSISKNEIATGDTDGDKDGSVTAIMQDAAKQAEAEKEQKELDEIQQRAMDIYGEAMVQTFKKIKGGVTDGR